MFEQFPKGKSLSDLHWNLTQASKVEKDETKPFDGRWNLEEPTVSHGWSLGDQGLCLKDANKLHALSKKLTKPLEFKERDMVVLQYEAKFQQQLQCGGAYLKLIKKQDQDFDSSKFSDRDEYVIMFGPDRCGDNGQVRLIFKRKNAAGETIEHHSKERINHPTWDSKQTHLYTLLVFPTKGTFEVRVDNVKASSGSFLTSFSPSFEAKKEIDDPSDVKPEDWDDREKIPDATAQKPEDWDETQPSMIQDPNAKMPSNWLLDEKLMIPDPTAKVPDSWDVELDGEYQVPVIPNPKCSGNPAPCGEWKAPSIRNPLYKGPWNQPMIDNPAFRGKWSPKTIPNPNYVEVKNPGFFDSVAAVGFDLWTLQNGTLFDNILVSDSMTLEQLKDLTEKTWVVKHEKESKLEVKNVEEVSWKDQFNIENMKEFISLLKDDPLMAWNKYPGLLGILSAVFTIILFTFLSSLRKQKTNVSEKKDSADEDEETKNTESVVRKRKTKKSE